MTALSWRCSRLTLALLTIVALSGVTANPCSPSILNLITTPQQWEVAAKSAAGIGDCDCIASNNNVSVLHVVAIYAPLKINNPGVVVAFVAKLERGGARLLAQDARNATALHIAAGRGSDAVASALCYAASKQGQLLELLQATDITGATAMAVAESNGNFRIARMLFLSGSTRGTVNASSEGDNACAYSVLDAVLLGAIDQVRVEAGAQIGSGNFSWANCYLPGDRRGRNLLHLAAAVSGFAAQGQVMEIVEYLLIMGADPTRTDSSGEMPLVEAVRADQADIAAALLRASPAGAVNTMDGFQRTPLHVAAAVGAWQCTGVLLRFGANASLRDKTGLTPLDLANRSGYTEVLRRLELAVLDPLGVYNTVVVDGLAKVGSGWADGLGSGGPRTVVIVVIILASLCGAAVITGLVIACFYRRATMSRGGYTEGFHDDVTVGRAKAWTALEDHTPDSRPSSGGSVDPTVALVDKFELQELQRRTLAKAPMAKSTIASTAGAKSARGSSLRSSALSEETDTTSADALAEWVAAGVAAKSKAAGVAVRPPGRVDSGSGPSSGEEINERGREQFRKRLGNEVHRSKIVLPKPVPSIPARGTKVSSRGVATVGDDLAVDSVDEADDGENGVPVGRKRLPSQDDQMQRPKQRQHPAASHEVRLSSPVGSTSGREAQSRSGTLGPAPASPSAGSERLSPPRSGGASRKQR